ncbi:MAG TPA: 2-succinyl-5-enolpyruvyl-6-hydroxy-3-cyclohexene-1-carboxylic-acid synthase, partial [Acidimicrobiaceae bacterium]|nr:2-succinyl-5-enolpyruvyl-6-hydroxy-3-cyclohexene-1-carboxylic-acid synthase [Acidimicrobiaceae bacterium]
MSEPVYGPIAAFAGQLAALGVRDVVISPGSRSTPLSLAFHAHPALRTHIQLDERSAGFFALGQAKASGRPSVLICTSGTAAANYLPAVVEANHACVPMIVCTADRPPELRGWGAGQTIDQVGMYTTNVRWAADLPVPSDWSEPASRLAATRAYESSVGAGRGPVHLNWPLRKPLEPVDGVPVREYPTPDDQLSFVSAPTTDRLVELGAYERGVILVGPDAVAGITPGYRFAEDVAELARALAWPVIGEPMSGMRLHDDVAIASAEHLLKRTVREELRPDVVVKLGGAPTTASVNQWLEAVQPRHVVLVDGEHRWHDASFTTTEHHAVDANWWVQVSRLAEARGHSEWLDRWRALDTAATAVVDEHLIDGRRSSGRVVRELCAGLPEWGIVMSSNSMPPRDLDAFVPAGTCLGFAGNRGAAGIDGITSTALGLATQINDAVPVVVFTGDLALLHDIGGLIGVERAGQRLTVVCIDNDGGQIFSMLPIHGRIDAADFETIFRTPHGVDLAQLQGLAGIDVTVVDEGDDLPAVLQAASAKTEPGVDLVIVRIDPDHDMAVRRSITT